MTTLRDLFEHQLKNLYNAEEQLVDALPKMKQEANDQQLKTIFSNHLEETKEEFKRLEEICDELDISPSGQKCEAMEGLIKQVKQFMQNVTDTNVMDAGLIAEAQHIEHYEISAYGTAVRYAKELGFDAIAEKLQKSLDEEYSTDKKLNTLAKSRINEEAMV